MHSKYFKKKYKFRFLYLKYNLPGNKIYLFKIHILENRLIHLFNLDNTFTVRLSPIWLQVIT